jgi:hypothetical protein
VPVQLAIGAVNHPLEHEADTPSLRPSAVPVQLAIGAVNHPLEHEADCVADQVTRMANGQLPLSATPVHVSRTCSGCTQDEEGGRALQPKAAAGAEAPAGEAPANVRAALNGPGRLLDASSRAFFEPRFGRDLSHVRIHTDAHGARSALAVNSLVYTVGRERNANLSTPNDPYEREADAVADRVMRMVDPGSIDAAPPTIQRRCAACEEERDAGASIQAQRAASPLPASSTTLAEAERATAPPGQPLAGPTRAFFEPRFGWDLRHVRVHADGEAARAAHAIQARAYTLGSHIVFGSGQYAPETTDGRRLIAHELAHVVQQSDSARHPSRSRLPSVAGALIARQPDSQAGQPDGQSAPTDAQAQALPAQDEGQGAEGPAPNVEEARGDAMAAAMAEGGQPAPGGQGGVGSSTTAPVANASAQALPSNTVECLAKWSSRSAPYSPGEWAARISYHCPIFPGLPGTTRPAFVDIPDEFVGVDPSGADMFRCRPRSSVVNRANIADAFAFALTRQQLFPDSESCHAGFRAILRAALEVMFRPSGGGRPAGIKVMNANPGGTFPC